MMLMDDAGSVVDKTPEYRDPGEGDDKSWQRRYDGSVIWKFSKNTKMAANMPENFNIKTEITEALRAEF